MSLSFANVRQFYTAKTTPGSGAKWNSFIVELIHQSLPHAASVEGVPRKKNDVLSWMSGWLEKIWAEPKKGMAEWMCGRFFVVGARERTWTMWCVLCCYPVWTVCPILIIRARVPGVICFYAPSRILKPRELFKRSFHVASWVYFEFIVVEPSFLCFSRCTCAVRLLMSVLRYVTYHSCRVVLL